MEIGREDNEEKILGVMMIATMVVYLQGRMWPCKAEEYPEMIVFDDVPYGFWAYDAILDLAYNKIIVGYGNGKVRCWRPYNT